MTDKPARACIRCGDRFTGQRRTARYCTRQCADAARAKRYRDRRATSLLFAEQSRCSVCDRPYLAVVGRGTKRLFCSEDCRAIARKLRDS